MPKPDFPPLLPPGVHARSDLQIFALAVSPFPADAKRAWHYARFNEWMERLRRLGIGGILWVDGSFLTEKPGPGDIDVVLWNPMSSRSLGAAAQKDVHDLIDPAVARMLYGLDLYVESPTAADLIHRKAYWKGFFGYCHDEVTAKGFAEVPL